ncbi:MAG: hypothetical protein L3J08_04425 [Flavobacteriaceae bacterium]|nr:hypothetical protein [Flavobacteriaceae bacterium]
MKSNIKSLFGIVFFFSSFLSFSQIDFSDQWEDFYSYNNVRDFVKIDDKIYAIADNASFIYDINTNEIEKISSIHGLSGKETSSVFYSESTERFIIGYRSGLIEIIDNKGKITISNDIERLDITGQKQINHISEFEDILYLSTPFGIVQYDIQNLNFGDTYYIDINSNPVFVNQTIVFQNNIYAVTTKGVYIADIKNPNLIDFNNWLQPQGSFLGDFSAITVFNDEIFTSKGNNLYKIISQSSLQQIKSYETIINLKSSDEYLTIATKNRAYVLNSGFSQIFMASQTGDYDFSLYSAFSDSKNIFLATSKFGILQSNLLSVNYQEIHPKGPISNQVFSITVQEGNLWVVYGGYNGSFTPLGNRLGYSHFNELLEENEQWINTSYDLNFPAIDLVHITLDPNHENKAYLSSWNRGILVVENDENVILLNDTNSGLEDLYPEGSSGTSTRINGSAFDNQGNLWVANAWVSNRLKKLNTDGTWSSFDLSSIMTNRALGLTELVVDKSRNIWIGSRRNGALVFNESGNRKRALITKATKGSLPDLSVRTLAVDRNNQIWIGTQKGLVIYTNPGSLFEADIYDAKPKIIADDGVFKKLLGDQPINSIAIDGAENKWFGTDTGGVLGTNPSGEETLYNFNKDNSPLPSNRILKVKVDNSNGRVYFATDKGIVAFNSDVAPFGKTLGEVYAYPNPAKSEHEFVTIDGRHGTHLPRGTNVKILDAAGKLVHETNIKIGQEIKGGKVIWDKTNLAGRRVASGIYIVLLTSPDKSETASTKIAIIN